MDHTYDKASVLAAAKATIGDIRACRELALDDYKHLSILAKIGAELGVTKIDTKHYRQRLGKDAEAIAERVAFKAQFCVEHTVFLNDAEIDIIKRFWGN